jgi:type IV pilus assembly protein PilA
MGETRYNSDGQSVRGRGFSLVELLIVVAIILIIVAIAIPNMVHARMAANQAAAVSNVRSITTAALTYQSTYQNGFPPDLDVLGGTGVGNCNSAILLDEVVAAVPHSKSGYQFSYTGENGNVPTSPAGCGAPGFNGYFIVATPIVESVTGLASFCSFTPATIYFDNSGAPAADPNACSQLSALQ